MDSLDKEKRIEYAKALLENPVYIETMEKIENTFIDTWKKTREADKDTRESCWKMWKLTLQFKAIISSCAFDADRKIEKLTDFDTG